MKKQNIITAAILAIGAVAGAALLFMEPAVDSHGHEEDAEGANAFERGPNGGRMLRDGDFAIEVTIYETGVPPEFRLYPSDGGKPVDVKTVGARIELGRLGNKTDVIAFAPEGGYLRGQQTVEEPHSFDVKVNASYRGKAHAWTYESHEGRTEINAEAAKAAGIEIVTAGPATIVEVLTVPGRIMVDPTRSAHVRARFSGVVREVRKQLGERVTRGEVLLTVESNESLQPYVIRAPVGGVVIAHNVSIGEVTGDAPLMEISDVSRVIAELHVPPREAGRVTAGLPVKITTVDGAFTADAAISSIVPTTDAATQTVIARAVLENPAEHWRPGRLVEAAITVSSRTVPLAVRTDGMQTFRDFTVVFAKVGDTYEVRMLDLGARDGVHAEVLGGLEPGTQYVGRNSFIVKADIEKSGASHDH